MKLPPPLTLTLATALLSAQAHAELTPGQMSAAKHVYVGDAECEFKQNISLKAIDGQPGHFELRFKKARYTMTPQETTTGAVRLEDRSAGLVWIQIPAKSMLLNSRLGQRLVDACLHAEQREEATTAAAAAAAGTAPSGIGVAATR